MLLTVKVVTDFPRGHNWDMIEALWPPATRTSLGWSSNSPFALFLPGRRLGFEAGLVNGLSKLALRYL